MKQVLNIGFIPIVCTAPLLYAHSSGLFEQAGLRVNLHRAPGWSGIKELIVYNKLDAAHMLVPMLFACNLGIDGQCTSTKLAMVQNVNGQALTLANRHLHTATIRDMRGFTFGVPYIFSMHYYLLCYLLAEHGIHPLHDVTITEVAPPLMPYYLEKGRIDGYIAPEPFNQLAVYRGVGFIYMLSRDIWHGHPCCGLAVNQNVIEQRPEAYHVLVECTLQAEIALHTATEEEKRAIARAISGPNYLNQRDPTVIEQVLTGHFNNGKGTEQVVPDRIDFVPYLYEDHGLWILSQMQRWGHYTDSIDANATLQNVLDSTNKHTLAEASQHFATAHTVLPLWEPEVHADEQKSDHKYDKKTGTINTYELSERLQERLSTILSHLADVAGGRSMELGLSITSDDEIGFLERMLNELVRNMRFNRDTLHERMEMQEQLQQQLIDAQQNAIRELSAPLLPISDTVVIMPLIGSIDTQRAQQIMETLLEGVAQHKAEVAIVDITGVQVVDTQVANALVQTAQAVQLLGAQVILTGIGPAMAQTLVHLGVDLSSIITRGSLQSAIAYAMQV